MNIGSLRVLEVQEAELAPGLRHVEIYTGRGLVTLLWHGPADADRVVLAGGGAMGGLLGPADGFYQDLGVALGAEGIGVIRVGYRVPNDLGLCIGDLAAAGMLAERNGAERIVTMGHSFGGAVAIGAALDPSPIAGLVCGIVTFATQSAGCEEAAGIAGRPFLLLHGDMDEILPVWSSAVVREIAGCGDLHVLPGAGHMLRENGADLAVRELTLPWVRAVLGR